MSQYYLYTITGDSIKWDGYDLSNNLLENFIENGIQIYNMLKMITLMVNTD